MTSTVPLLQAQGIHKSYKDRRRRRLLKALNGVSFELEAGETLGIVGESGSGKSTLAKVLVRLTDTDEGTVTYRGLDVLAPSREEARQLTREIQIVFQDPSSSMHPRHSVRKALAEAAAVAGEGQQDLAELLRAVGVSPDKLTSYPHELSGGQKQRVAIARALAVGPSIIVADECVSALDVSVQSSILNLLLELQTQHALSYLFISHDLSVVNHMSDRIIVMKDGNIIESGAADQVMFDPQQEYTKRLLASLPGTGG